MPLLGARRLVHAKSMLNRLLTTVLWGVLLLPFSMVSVRAETCQGKLYTVPAGKHYSGLHVGVTTQARVDFTACFDASAAYDLGNENQYDANKLYGLSDCSSLHHRNSARFGWRWSIEKKTVELMAYSYAGGVRAYDVIGDLEPGVNAKLSIRMEGNRYVFSYNGREVQQPRSCSDGGGVKYRLYPYFGGNEVASHDVHVWIQK